MGVSVPNVMLTSGRRTTDSSGYVSYQTTRSHTLIRADRAFTHFFQFDFIDREGLEAPPTGQNKDNVYQCKKHSSPSTSFTLASCTVSRDQDDILMFRLFQNVPNVMVGRNRSRVRGSQLKKLVKNNQWAPFVAICAVE